MTRRTCVEAIKRVLAGYLGKPEGHGAEKVPSEQWKRIWPVAWVAPEAGLGVRSPVTLTRTQPRWGWGFIGAGSQGSVVPPQPWAVGRNPFGISGRVQSSRRAGAQRSRGLVPRVLVKREGRIVDDTRETERMLDADWLAGHYVNGGKS